MLEVFIWIALMSMASVPFLMVAWEQGKTAKMQEELLKEQLEINRRWDIINKHTRRMSDRISEIHRESHERWVAEQSKRRG